MCTVHVLMRFCHLINRSFACKAKEGRYVRIINFHDVQKYIIEVGVVKWLWVLLSDAVQTFYQWHEVYSLNLSDGVNIENSLDMANG
jgi:hypothetical protein